MRALVIAPADVQADAVARQAVQGVFQRLDMGRRDLQELLVRQLGEKHVARQGKVGAVELQVEARVKDRAVFVAHRIGQGLQIGLTVRVMRVLQEEADHAGRGRVHEAALNPVRRHRGL